MKCLPRQLSSQVPSYVTANPHRQYHSGVAKEIMASAYLMEVIRTMERKRKRKAGRSLTWFCLKVAYTTQGSRSQGLIWKDILCAYRNSTARHRRGKCVTIVKLPDTSQVQSLPIPVRLRLYNVLSWSHLAPLQAV